MFVAVCSAIAAFASLALLLMSFKSTLKACPLKEGEWCLANQKDSRVLVVRRMVNSTAEAIRWRRDGDDSFINIESGGHFDVFQPFAAAQIITYYVQPVGVMLQARRTRKFSWDHPVYDLVVLPNGGKR